MKNVARLVDFSGLAAECPDALFFTTTKDPSHSGNIDPEKIPDDWSITDYDDGVPDTEETLDLPKGTRLILYSQEKNVAAFYLAKGKKSREAGATAFKQLQEVVERYKADLASARRDIEERDALIAAQARRIDKLERKKDKLKKKLQERDDADALGFIDQVVSTGVETTARMFGIQIPGEEEGESETDGN